MSAALEELRRRGPEERLCQFSAPSFPSVTDAEAWWNTHRGSQSAAVQQVGDLVVKAHRLYVDGKRAEAADAYAVAADAAELLGWTKGLGDECRQSSWWCRDLARRDDLQRQAVAIACEHGFDACPKCDDDRLANDQPKGNK